MLQLVHSKFKTVKSEAITSKKNHRCWLTDPSLHRAAALIGGTSPSLSSKHQPEGSLLHGMWSEDLVQAGQREINFHNSKQRTSTWRRRTSLYLAAGTEVLHSPQPSGRPRLGGGCKSSSLWELLLQLIGLLESLIQTCSVEINKRNFYYDTTDWSRYCKKKKNQKTKHHQ